MYKVLQNIVKGEELMRDVYCKTLMDLAKTNKNIVALDADLISSSGMKPFFNAYPDRAYSAA
jgi:transketolase